MLIASNRIANDWLWSTLTLTTLTRPACWRANASSIGLTMRHGPHHGAHRSRTTVGDAFVSASNVSWSASTTHASGLPHVPQCGAPLALGRIRFTARQSAHVNRETGPDPLTGSERCSLVMDALARAR